MANNFSSDKDGMQMITIPFDFAELPHSVRSSIVPIWLPTRDDDGSTIAWGWFEAIVGIQTPLRNLARSVLGDTWRVSEVTESALKVVWRNCGTDFGIAPQSRVYAQARWCARDLAAGGGRNRRGLDVALDELDNLLRSRILTDPHDYRQQYSQDLDLAMIEEQLRTDGMADLRQMLRLLRDGCTWKEIGVALGQNPPNVQKKFRRWIRRVSATLRSNG
jgi:hypothetical protein